MNYLFSKKIDWLGMYIPFTLLWISFLFVPNALLYKDFPTWAWLIFVLGFDVSHVWSTLFRTYFNKEEFTNHRTFLLAGPIFLFFIAFSLAFISLDWFWRVLAYIAVFHFIRQQYGFLALYRARKGIKISSALRKLDKLIIYTATGFPILIWHFNDATTFHWFTSGDFFSIGPLSFIYPILKWGLSAVFGLIFILWLVKNIKEKVTSTGAFLWVGFTILNWFGAIVFINSDYVFTLTNVVAHGLPYMLLIIFYKTKTATKNHKKHLFFKWSVIVLSTILALAFVEEYFWDTLVNHEHTAIFGSINSSIENGEPSLIALFVALLALPQIWHYFVDGIIWKANDKNPFLKQIFSSKK